MPCKVQVLRSAQDDKAARTPRDNSRGREATDSDFLKVRRRVQKVIARIIEDPVERPLGLHTEHLVDPAECEVVTPPGLVATWIREPRLQADALYECRRLPRGRHRIIRCCRPRIGRPRTNVQEPRQSVCDLPHCQAADVAIVPKIGSVAAS